MTAKHSFLFFAALLFAGFFLFSALGVCDARASSMTETYSFTLGNFIDVVGDAAPPITSVSGSVTVTLDPTLPVTNQTMGITQNSLTGLSLGSPVGFTVFPAGGGFPLSLYIGGVANGADYLGSDFNDYLLGLSFSDPSKLSQPTLFACVAGIPCGTATGNTGVLQSGYSLVGSNSVFLAQSGSVNAISPVPLPATWGMMLLALGFLGYFGYCQKKTAHIAT